MEQRWSPRINTNIDVELNFNGKCLKACHTRDVAMGGVFVELDRCFPPKGVNVLLTLNLRGKKGLKKYRLKAKVVRVEKHGVGMKFKDHGTDMFRSLRTLFHYTRNDAG